MMTNYKYSQINVTDYLISSGAIVSAAPPSTNITQPNLTAPAILFNVSQYTPSNTCQVQAPNGLLNDTICCNNPAVGVNGTQFCDSLTTIGNEWVAEVDMLCAELGSNNVTCTQSSANATNASNGINSSSFQDCGANATWGWAVTNNATSLYAYLQNNPIGVNELVTYC